MEQQIKDLVLSLQWLRLLVWRGFSPWHKELPHATGTAKKKNYYYFSFCFLELHPRHMEVPRLGAELELELLATATVM